MYDKIAFGTHFAYLYHEQIYFNNVYSMIAQKII